MRPPIVRLLVMLAFSLALSRAYTDIRQGEPDLTSTADAPAQLTEPEEKAYTREPDVTATPVPPTEPEGETYTREPDVIATPAPPTEPEYTATPAPPTEPEGETYTLPPSATAATAAAETTPPPPESIAPDRGDGTGDDAPLPISEFDDLPFLTNDEGHLAVRYFKHLLSILDSQPDARAIANNVRVEFAELNADGRLGIAARSLLELRLEDLLLSVRSYRKLRQVLELLLGQMPVRPVSIQ